MEPSFAYPNFDIPYLPFWIGLFFLYCAWSYYSRS